LHVRFGAAEFGRNWSNSSRTYPDRISSGCVKSVIANVPGKLQ
jgi:hypothetical protein